MTAPNLKVPVRRMTDAVIAAHRWLDSRPDPAERAAFVAHVETLIPTRAGQAYCGALRDLIRRASA